MGVKLALPEKSDGSMEVMPTNWASLLAFLECQTQWKAEVGMSGVIWFGLRYQDCKIVLDAINAGPEIFADIRTMELAALPILNEAD